MIYESSVLSRKTIRIGIVVININIFMTKYGVLCKNNMNRLFQINFDENLIFQKLTDQESIILMALDNL